MNFRLNKAVGVNLRLIRFRYKAWTASIVFCNQVWSIIALAVSGFCCQASDKNFSIGEILTNPPPLTIEYTRQLEINPVAFNNREDAEKYDKLLKSGKVRLEKGLMSCLFYFNRKDKVFWFTDFTNSTGQSVLQRMKSGIIIPASGCCEQGCWVKLPHDGLGVDTNEFNFDSVVSRKDAGFFWNPFRMASEVLRFGMFELVETTAHFDTTYSHWEGKSESGDLVVFTVLPQRSNASISIEYSVPKLNIKRHIELNFDQSAAFDLGFPSRIVVFADKNGAMSKYCQYDIKSFQLDKQLSRPECALATILSSSHPLVIYNNGKPLFRNANGTITSMIVSGSTVDSKSIKAIKVNVLLFIFAMVNGLAIFLLVRIKSNKNSKQKQQTP
jgi:hypothetical protein